MGKRVKRKMPDDLAFEVKCREIVLKKLEKPLAALQASVEKENAARLARTQELLSYMFVEEAQEAYGYDLISWEEYEAIRLRFEGVEEASQSPTTPNAAALSIMRDFTNRLNREILSFQWEALPDSEKQRIAHEREERAERVLKRRQAGIDRQETNDI